MMYLLSYLSNIIKMPWYSVIHWVVNYLLFLEGNLSLSLQGFLFLLNASLSAIKVSRDNSTPVYLLYEEETTRHQNDMQICDYMIHNLKMFSMCVPNAKKKCQHDGKCKEQFQFIFLKQMIGATSWLLYSNMVCLY